MRAVSCGFVYAKSFGCRAVIDPVILGNHSQYKLMSERKHQISEGILTLALLYLMATKRRIPCLANGSLTWAMAFAGSFPFFEIENMNKKQKSQGFE